MPDQISQPLDPDQWMAAQGQAKPQQASSPIDPDEWMKANAASGPGFNPPKKQIPPAPGVSGITGKPITSNEPTLGDPAKWAAEHAHDNDPSLLQRAGKYFFGIDSTPKATPPKKQPAVGPHIDTPYLDALTDPKVYMPAIAGAVAAPFTEGMSLLPAMTTMGAATATGTGLAHGMNELSGIPQPPLHEELASSFAGGAGPEMFSPAIRAGMNKVRGATRFNITPQGQAVKTLLGDQAGLAQVVDHPAVDWLRNIAEGGMGGAATMEGAKAARNDMEKSMLEGEARSLAPKSGARLLPNLEDQGGQNARDAIVGNIGKNYSGVVRPAWETVDMYGGLPSVVQKTESENYSVAELMSQRKDLNAQYQAIAHDDRPGMPDTRRKLQIQLQGLDENIMDSLPPDGQQAYTEAKAFNKQHSEKFENPTVRQVLQSPTKVNDVLEMIYNPKKLRTWDTTVMSGGRAVQQSLDNTQLLSKVKDAAGPTEWAHLKAAAVEHLVNAAIDDKGNLNPDKLRNLYEAMGEGPQNLIFGGNKAQFDSLIDRIAYAERPAKTKAGTLFISIRQGAGAMNAGAAVAGAGAALMGLGYNGPGVPALMTGTAMMLAPNMIAKILVSPDARDFLTRAASAPPGPAQNAMIEMAKTAAIQEFGRAGIKGTATKLHQNRNQDLPPTMETGGNIHAPLGPPPLIPPPVR